MDFMNRLMPPARWRIVCMALLVVGIFLCLMTYTNEGSTVRVAAVLDLGLAIGGTAAFWRCPRCRRMLPLKNMMYVKQCSYCKADVQGF